MANYLKGIDAIRRENVLKLMKDNGLNRNGLADKTGISYSLLGHYIGKNPTKKIGDEIAAKIEKAFNKPSHWLDNDQLGNAGIQSNVVVGKIETDIQIPIYAAYFCCGDGNDADFEELKGYRGFSSDFFKTRNIKPDNFVLVCAANDSMSPHIEHKDEVGIDISDKEIKDGEVYAILLDGAKMFKQVFVEAGGNLRLHSFNPNYPDKLITPQNHNSLIVVGRKVYRAG